MGPLAFRPGCGRAGSACACDATQPGRRHHQSECTQAQDERDCAWRAVCHKANYLRVLFQLEELLKHDADAAAAAKVEKEAKTVAKVAKREEKAAEKALKATASAVRKVEILLEKAAKAARQAEPEAAGLVPRGRQPLRGPAEAQ